MYKRQTHNTDLKKRLAAYAGQHPDQCRQTDADPETGCMEFDIEKGRFSFRLTAPYSEERRNAASKAAKKHSGNLTHPIQMCIRDSIYTERKAQNERRAFTDTQAN